MAIQAPSRLLLAALLVSAPVCLTQAASAQNTPATPPCPTPSQNSDQADKPCPPPATNAKKPSVSEQFPFPGEPAKPAPPNSPSPSTNSGSAPGTTPSSAAAQHPFPAQRPPKLPGDDDSSSSSSSSSSSADDPNANPDTTSPDTEKNFKRHKLPKVQHVQSDDERVDEDLKVSKFYLNAENFPGAYLRAKDAVKVQPDYSATHFALAEVAQKMKKKDEAIAEYSAYLKLDPDGEKAKAARQALQSLQ